MPAKRFSEFTKIPLGQAMQVVGLIGGENTLSEGQVYLLSKPEIDEIKDNTTSNSGDIVQLKERVTELEGGSGGPTMDDIRALQQKDIEQDAAIASLGKIPTRKKSEVSYAGLNITLTAGTAYNLINRLKANTPLSGTLAPFFNVASEKMNVFDDDNSVLFKLNVTGSWPGSSTTNKSMQIDFEGPTANRQTKSRDEAVTSDVISFPTFFSIDKGGFIASNGSAITIRSNGSNFTITAITLIAEQVTTLTNISAH